MEHPPINNISLASILHALGDTNRLTIAKAIYNSNSPLTCTQAVKGMTNLAVSTRSHCFKILREGGVIHSDKHGRDCLNTIRLDEIEQKFPGVLSTLLSN